MTPEQEKLFVEWIKAALDVVEAALDLAKDMKIKTLAWDNCDWEQLKKFSRLITTLAALDKEATDGIEAYEQAQWQEIADEHKDGSSMLLSDGYDTFPGYWEKRPNHWGETGWQEEDAKSRLYLGRCPLKPTHCRPFPPPPTEKK